MPKILFQKGNKFAKGGKRDGAGPKTKAQKAALQSLREAIEHDIKKDTASIARVYLKFAKTDQGTMRHLVDRAIPAAKQELEISGGLRIIKVDAFDPDAG